MKKFLTFLLILILLLGGGALYGWNYYNGVGEKPLKTEEETILVTVEPNDNFSSVLNRLDNEGLLKNLLVTRIYFRYHPKETKLKPGTYTVHAQGTLHEIIEELNTGKDINEIVVTLPEGLNVERMGEVFEEKGMFTKDAFVNAVANYPTPTWLENLEGRRYAMEGFLFPSTYKFKRGQTPEYIVDYLYRAFVSQMNSIASELGTSIPTSKWNEVLTIAAMIEREAANTEEMPVISSVIYNRMAANMKLQIDATVVYALGLSAKDHVTLDDLKVVSPYNTYLNKGLPLGPIASPGAAAIKAALRPAQNTGYLYYVLNPATDSHFFTANYNEFLQKKAEYANN